MTKQDKLDNHILAAVVESMTYGEGAALEAGDIIENLDVRHGDEGPGSWTRYNDVAVEERHVRAAKALLARFPLGYRDPGMTEADAMTWAKTWAERAS